MEKRYVYSAGKDTKYFIMRRMTGLAAEELEAEAVEGPEGGGNGDEEAP